MIKKVFVEVKVDLWVVSYIEVYGMGMFFGDFIEMIGLFKVFM